MLRCLDVLVGAWSVVGSVDVTDAEIRGEANFAWMAGGFFLVHRLNLTQADNCVKAVEYIGYGDASKALCSHYFDNTGSILNNVWELTDHTLVIWSGAIGAAASFKSKFSDDHNTITGRWEWPGGGYALTMSRVDQSSLFLEPD